MVLFVLLSAAPFVICHDLPFPPESFSWDPFYPLVLYSTKLGLFVPFEATDISLSTSD